MQLVPNRSNDSIVWDSASSNKNEIRLRRFVSPGQFPAIRSIRFPLSNFNLLKGNVLRNWDSSFPHLYKNGHYTRPVPSDYFCITDHHPGIGFGNIIIPGTVLMFVYQHVIHHAGFFIDLIDFNTISFQIVRKDPFFKRHLRFCFRIS